MEKKCKVVLLSTDDNTDIIKTSLNELVYQEKPTLVEGEISQHLYILSDDEIKEGDWCYMPKDGNLMEELWNVSDIQKLKDAIRLTGRKRFKVIATTNPDLIKEGIASIDDEFIKGYCNNPIEEIFV